MTSVDPSQLTVSIEYTRLSCLMYTLYPSIGAPLSDGATQSITTFDESTVVVGASGLLGLDAAKIETSFE